MSEETFAESQALDVDFEVARAIHRVVRAMHDGECPQCHFLFRSDVMQTNPPGAMGPSPGDHVCPRCHFTITVAEHNAAMVLFAPVMERNLKVFEDWRQTLTEADSEHGHGYQLAKKLGKRV